MSSKYYDSPLESKFNAAGNSGNDSAKDPANEAANELAKKKETAEERRRKRRVKVSAQVRVRATDPKSDGFTEIATTVDVSRDGILFASDRRDYWNGMRVGVTFPYSAAANALNVETPALVVRTLEIGGGKMGVAVQLHHTQQKAAAATARSGPGSKEKSTMHGASTAVKGAPPLGHITARPIVLAVDEDVRAQELLKSLLTPEGYDVFVVGSGKAALDILRTTTPACFIAEVESVDTSGYDLCLIIKNNERLARVPVVLLTRNAKPADYAASHNFGAVICMAKPFTPERMLQVVKLVAPPPSKEVKSSYGTSRNEASMIERDL